MSSKIETIKSLGFVWETSDPFLFCVHHQDAYPIMPKLNESDIPVLMRWYTSIDHMVRTKAKIP